MKTIQSTPMQAIIVISMLLMSACNPLSSAMDTDPHVAPVKSYSQAEVEAKYQRNPNPKQRYDIVMKIENAPGPFALAMWSAQYEAPECIYLLSKFAGVHSRPHTAVNVDFKKIDETTYAGSVYLDAMLDEDYFGSGICKWKMTFANVSLMATGDEVETRFVVTSSVGEIKAQKIFTRYYWKKYYPRAEMERFSDSGDPDIGKVPDDKKNEFFNINITPKAMQL